MDAVVFGLLALAVYFIPSIIAFRRQHPNKWIILALNVVTGVTIIGWGVIFFWASSGSSKASASHPDGSSAGGEKLDTRISGTKTEQLVQLKSLLDDGAIDSDEYEMLKKEILEGSASLRVRRERG